MKKQIQLVYYEKGWIIEKIVQQWASILEASNFKTIVSFNDSKNGSDVYIHFIYLNTVPVKGARNIVYVTHVDKWWKAIKLILLAREGVEFVTMSRETQSLVKRYTGSSAVYCINPVSIHFKTNQPPKKVFTFGLFFRLYDDDRKSNNAINKLVTLAEKLNPVCKLILFGAGFSSISEKNPNAASLMDIYDGPFDVVEYESCMKRCDYVVYFGRDEGAISILDAATLDIPVLAIYQGYHIDIPLAKGSMLFNHEDEILSIIKNICYSAQGEGLKLKNIENLIIDKADINNSSNLWHIIFIPFINNKFLIRENNLLHTFIYCYRLVFPKNNPNYV